MGNQTKQSGLSNKVVVGAAAVVVAAVVGVGAYVVSQNSDTTSGNTIGYATEAKVMLDEDALNAAMEESLANTEGPNVALRYKNNAYSEDGDNFDCYIVNAAENPYDMFLTIFSDAALKDQIFLSGLVPPGSGFEKITLDKKLEPGDHTVYVVVTQVTTDEDGNQAIRRQVTHTMDFHVS